MIEIYTYYCFVLNFDILLLVKLDKYLRNVDSFVSLKTYSWPARAVNKIDIQKINCVEVRNSFLDSIKRFSVEIFICGRESYHNLRSYLLCLKVAVMCNIFQIFFFFRKLSIFSFLFLFVIFFVYCALHTHYQPDALNHRSFKVIRYLNDMLVVNYRIGNAYWSVKCWYFS